MDTLHPSQSLFSGVFQVCGYRNKKFKDLATHFYIIELISEITIIMKITFIYPRNVYNTKESGAEKTTETNIQIGSHPSGRRQTSSLFTSAVGDLISELQ